MKSLMTVGNPNIFVLILSSLTEVLGEIFVVPAVREEKRKAILILKDEILGGKAKPELEEK